MNQHNENSVNIIKNIGMLTSAWLRFGSVILSMVIAPTALAVWKLNMPRGITAVSQSIYDLHMLIFWICVWIAVVVFGVMLYSIIRHRKSRGIKAAQFHESLGFELLWTAVPTLILIAMAVPATTTLMNMYDSSDADIDIKITGHQWKWQYDYLGEDISFFSNLTTTQDEIYNRTDKGKNYLLEVDKKLVIPSDKKVRFLITSNDVIHAWWVPEIAVKKDAIPGYINESWVNVPAGKEGLYRGQCAELCGIHHGFMPIVLEVVNQKQYQNWLGQQRMAKQVLIKSAQEDWRYDQLMEKGAKVYAARCATCHGAKGEGIGSVFPALAGSKIALNAVEAHINIVLNGKVGTAMQAFSNQLSDVDLAAVITYERNAWGNNTGDTVTPKSITNAKP